MAEKTSIKTVSVDGIETQYFTFGKGTTPLVILPGLSLKSVMLSAPAIKAGFADFEEEFTVYVLDRRKAIPPGHTVFGMADDTSKVMKKLGLSKACVFGASQGGMIALAVALDHPGLVDKLVLGSTASRMNKTAADTVGEWIRKAENRDRKGFTECTMKAMYSRETYEAYIDAFLAMSNDITDVEFDRFVIGAKACDGFDVYDRLPSIRAKTLVIGCHGDKVLGGFASYEISEKLGCDLFMYGDRYGHCVYDEAPDYRKIIKEFFVWTI